MLRFNDHADDGAIAASIVLQRACTNRKNSDMRHLALVQKEQVAHECVENQKPVNQGS